MANTRNTRESETIRSTREREMRDHNLLPEYNMGYVSPLALPYGVAREGYVYYWAERSHTTEVEQLYSKHWTLVPSDRCPNYTGDPLGRNPYASKYLCYRDLILMERPEIFSQQEMRAFYLRNQQAMTSMAATVRLKDDYHDNQAPSYRIPNYNSMSPNYINTF